MPLNHSFSTARSSGSIQKGAVTDECSEKFATLMLYCALWSRIHWQALMMSLVIPMPVSSSTSIETRFALGAAPAWCGDAPAATPATKVPWPRPSPAELFGSVLRLTEASRREPKSSRLWTPESTIAIVGMFAATVAFWSPSQLFELPVSYGQSWFDVQRTLPLTCAGASGVIERRPLA